MINRMLKTAICSLSGTSFMTLSSALFSLGKQDFREPRHLGRLIGRIFPFSSEEMDSLMGWVAHYGMGTAFSAVYVKVWEDKKVEHNLTSSLLLGAASGVLGIMIWKATFKLHPLSPWMDYRRFYLQRIPAHIVFAVFAALAYHLIRLEERKKLQGLKSSQSPVLIKG